MTELGENIARVLRPGDTVYLVGELGVGKTTLVQGIVRGLGYTGKVTSPTFALVNVYEAGIPVYHCDFYRLQEGDVLDLGLEDFLEKDGITLIEWPQKMMGELPSRALLIEITLTGNDYDLPRVVTIKGWGEEYEGRLEELKAIVGTGDR